MVVFVGLVVVSEVEEVVVCRVVSATLVVVLWYVVSRVTVVLWVGSAACVVGLDFAPQFAMQVFDVQVLESDEHWPSDVHFVKCMLAWYIKLSWVVRTYTMTRRTRIQRRQKRIVLRPCCPRHLRSTGCMRKGNWHWRCTRTQTDKITLLDTAASLPAIVALIPGLDLSNGDLVRFRHALTGILSLGGVCVADTVAVGFRRKRTRDQPWLNMAGLGEGGCGCDV